MRYLGSPLVFVLLVLFVTPSCTTTAYDVIIRGGTIYDGSGEQPFVGDVALHGDVIAAWLNREMA